jgi:fatty-acid desaturase
MKFLSSSTLGAQLFLLFAIVCSVAYGTSVESLHLIILGYFMYGCLGVVITFHRLLTHNSYKTHPLIVKIFSVLGCLGGTGSPIAWVAIHINHHLKSDKPEDPHSPHHKGLGIFKLQYENEVNVLTKFRMRKLITDSFQQLLHRYYFAILLSYDMILYLIGGLDLVVSLHLIPLVITVLMSNIVNYVGHMPTWLGAYRSFNLNDHSANNWLFAIPSWGESWHNNHHRFPKDYTFKKQWWEIDIAGFIIKLIKI